MSKLLPKSKYPKEMLSFLTEDALLTYVQFIIGFEVRKKIQSNTTPEPGHHNGKLTKTQEIITHKRTKRSALSHQMITRLQRTNKTILQT